MKTISQYSLCLFVALFVFFPAVAASSPRAKSSKSAVSKRDRYSNIKLRFAVGDALPALPVKNLDGAAVNFENVLKTGRKTIVVVWATWCGACGRVMPYLEKMRPALAQKSIEIVGLNVDLDKRPPVKEFFADKNIAFQTMVGDAKTANSIFANRQVAVPLVITVNENGRITAMSFGWSEDLLKNIESLAK
jgi:thiol-disulfide isomerase/thioredoxin